MNLIQSPESLLQKLEIGLEATRLGRQVLLGYFKKLKHVEDKFHEGLVSEADRESEKVMTDYLLKHLPGSEMLGEESAYLSKQKEFKKNSGSVPRWILDPLDGTTNYVHGMPIFCISLALEEQGQLQLGIIDVPVLNEIYTAVRGQGAFVNGERLQVSKTSQIEKSLLATGFFGEDEPALQEQLKVFTFFVRKARGIRRAGAAAYDLSQVARGVFDGYWEKNLKPWDVAAGQIIVEEAGGKVLTYDGRTHNPYENSLIAGNPKMADLIQSSVKVLVESVSKP